MRTLKALAARALLALSLAIAGPAFAGVITDHGENKHLDNAIRGQANAYPSTWHLALGTNTCSDAGSPTEPGDTYARQAVAASLANWAASDGAGTTVASTGTSGTTSNNNVIPYPESGAAWGNLQSVWFMDAASAGNAWFCIDLSAAFNVTGAGITVRFPAAAMSIQIDN